MTHFIALRTENSDNRETGDLGTRLAFENAYRSKKKTLISEIERSLGFSLRDAAPGLSGT